MFYSHFIYQRQGTLAKIWLASHIMRKMKAADIRSIDITQGAELLMTNSNKGGTPFALRLCGQLLIGLVKIWQEKAHLTSEHAKDILKKLEDMHVHDDRKAAAARRTSKHPIGLDAEDDDGKVSIVASARDLRGGKAQINLAIEHLGAGIADDFNLEDGMHGTEWVEAMGDLATDPDMVIDMGVGGHVDDFGILTGLSGNLSLDRAGEGEGEMMVDIENQSLEQYEDDTKGDIEGGRANVSGMGRADQDAADMMGMDDQGKDSMMHDPSMIGGSQEGGDFFGGKGGVDDFEHLLPRPDSKAASLAADVDDDAARIEHAIQEKTDALRELHLRKKADALRKKRKHAHQAYVPQIDAVTEIPSGELKRWIDDPSDTLKDATRPANQTRTAKENVEYLSQLTEAEEAPFSGAAAAGAPAGASSSSVRGLFNLPSTGLGRAATSDLSHLTRAAMQADAGRFGPRLMRLLQSRMTTDGRLAAFTYHLQPQQQEEDETRSIASRKSALELNGTGPGGLGAADANDDMNGSLGGINFGHDDAALNDLSFGADPFTQQQQQANDQDERKSVARDEEEEEEKKMRQEEEEAAAAAEMEGKEDEVDFQPGGDEIPVDEAHLAPSLEDDPETNEAVERQRRGDQQLAQFWGEATQPALGAEKKSRASKADDEAIESGWSKRTKKMHTKLKEQFGRATAATPISFDRLVQGRVREVAGTAFYQLLVLASGDFVRLQQTRVHGEIQVARTKTFDSKLPKTSGSNSNSAPMDSQQSQLF